MHAMEHLWEERPFSLEQIWPGPVAWVLERLLSLHQLSNLYERQARGQDLDAFLKTWLSVLDISPVVSPDEVARIPRTGPLVVVANHPFGALEGIIVAHILRAVRPDVKVMANLFLSRIPELRDLFFFVDSFAGPEAPSRNMRPLRDTIKWVKQGGAVIIFPAGTVSHISLRAGQVTDPPWSTAVVRIVRRTGSAVLPVFFPGANSPLFQASGLLHPRLRTALLPRELLKRQHQRIVVHIGHAIPRATFARLTPEDAVGCLRFRTYLLAQMEDPASDKPAILQGRTASPAVREPILAAQDPTAMAEEVVRLGKHRILARSGATVALIATAQEIPTVLREIGRLREVTFREAGEGTGQVVDLDHYDAYYRHLVLWHEERREVVGAYRVGLADEIVRRLGSDGLYTSTLYRFSEQFLAKIQPALELGRSFVRSEYQRSYAPLLLLWKGIGQFIVRHPKYKVLFGSVSISNTYRPVSQQLMVAFLLQHCTRKDLARHVVPAWTPPVARAARRMQKALVVCPDIEGVSACVADLESEPRAVPVLLRQYLKLGGKLLAFTKDPAFGNCLDGLIMVDLTTAPARALERYMGEAGVASFLAHHGVTRKDAEEAATEAS